MRLAVCALADLDAEVERLRPEAVVSLLGPNQPAPPVAAPRLLLRFNDIPQATEGLVSPDGEIVARLLAFAEPLPSEATLLLHCWMGVSRSPAAAFILACARRPVTPEAAIAEALREASPTATPNPMLVGLADAHLGRGGRMRAAIAAIGRGRETGSGAPFELTA